MARNSVADWTQGDDGRSNTSEEFERLCKEVERLIRHDAYTLVSGRADITAVLIMAELAHKHGMIPPSQRDALRDAVTTLTRKLDRADKLAAAIRAEFSLLGPPGEYLDGPTTHTPDEAVEVIRRLLDDYEDAR